MSAYFDVLLHVSNHVPQGAVFMAKHLLHVADRHDLDDLLPKFSRNGPIRRVARGLYFRPYRLMPHTRPTLDHIVRVRAEAYGETLEVHGADAARHFGIDVAAAPHPRETRSPRERIAARYYTGGRTRTLTVGAVEVRLQHVPDAILSFPGTAAGRALAAIHHLGPSGVATVHRQAKDEERERIRTVVRSLPHPILVAWREADRLLPMPIPDRRAPFDAEAHRKRLVAARRRRPHGPPLQP